MWRGWGDHSGFSWGCRKKWGDNPMKTYENPFSMGYIYIYIVM
jgi:hypothetical protein